MRLLFDAIVIDVFRFDGILAAAAHTGESEWLLAVNTDSKLKDLTLSVLHFTSLLIEYSFSRHSYSSVEVSFVVNVFIIF